MTKDIRHCAEGKRGDCLAEVTASDIPQEQQFMAEYWNFRKKFYNGESRDSFWEELYHETNRISEKYHSLYVDNMLLVCVEDIEARYNKSQGRSVNELEHFRHIFHVLERDRKDEP